MWKGLSDFGIPDPEIPASTPGDVAHLGIQKKKKCLRNNKLHLMHNFSTGCAHNRAAAHFCVFFTLKLLCRTGKTLGFWHHPISVLYC